MARHRPKPYTLTCKGCGESFKAAQPQALYCQECRERRVAARGKTLKRHFVKNLPQRELPPIRPAKEPTTAEPGSPEKLRIMEERYRLRQEIHHEEDRNTLLEALENVKDLTTDSM